MASPTPFKRLILRAVLHEVSPMVIGSFPYLTSSKLMRCITSFVRFSVGPAIWAYIIRVHAQEFNSFRRRSRSKLLRDFQLRRQEKFLYICDTLHLFATPVDTVSAYFTYTSPLLLSALDSSNT